MWTREFWVDTAERAIRTMAQWLATALTLVLGSDFITGAALELASVDLAALGIGTLVSGLYAVLTAVAASGIGPKGTPSTFTEPVRKPEEL
jgi:hypothetical protein